MADCFQKLSKEQLLEGLQPYLSPEKTKIDLFLPVVETVKDSETFLPACPKTLYATGQVEDRPWMTGVTSEEGAFFLVDLLGNATHRQEVQNDWEVFVDSHIFLTEDEKRQHLRTLRNFYFGGPENDHADPLRDDILDGYSNIISDGFYFRYLPKSIRAHATASKVYPYWYSKQAPSVVDAFLDSLEGEKKPPTKRRYLGVAHFDECYMLFNYHGFYGCPKDSEHYGFSKDMVRTWVQFAEGEEPSFRGVGFPVVSKGSSDQEIKYLRIDEKPEIIDFPHPERFKLWNDLGLIDGHGSAKASKTEL